LHAEQRSLFLSTVTTEIISVNLLKNQLHFFAGNVAGTIGKLPTTLLNPIANSYKPQAVAATL
jgi:hypothetical protein